MLKNSKENVTDKLIVNKFHADNDHSHIEVDKTYPDSREIDRIVRVCPASLYSTDENGALLFDHLGCLECGTCKVLSGGKVVKEWNYPAGAMGIEYRLG